jgi:nicotinamide-nucleotide amidase
VVAYSNELKHRLLGVEEDTLTRFGAVSEETVKEMLSGLLQHLGVDYGVAVSGIAGPGGATPEKPVGTVWIAVGNASRSETKLWQLRGDRLRIIESAAVLAMDQLRRFLKGEGIN